MRLWHGSSTTVPCHNHVVYIRRPSDVLPDDPTNARNRAHQADSPDHELNCVLRVSEPPNELLESHAASTAKPEASSNDALDFRVEPSSRLHLGAFGPKLSVRTTYLMNGVSGAVNGDDRSVF